MPSSRPRCARATTTRRGPRGEGRRAPQDLDKAKPKPASRGGGGGGGSATPSRKRGAAAAAASPASSRGSPTSRGGGSAGASDGHGRLFRVSLSLYGDGKSVLVRAREPETSDEWRLALDEDKLGGAIGRGDTSDPVRDVFGSSDRAVRAEAIDALLGALCYDPEVDELGVEGASGLSSRPSACAPRRCTRCARAPTPSSRRKPRRRSRPRRAAAAAAAEGHQGRRAGGGASRRPRRRSASRRRRARTSS